MKQSKLNKTLKHIRIYDNGGETLDRYTAVFMMLKESGPNEYSAVGMSENPFSPQGFGQHTIATPGRHLGRRIKFSSLPKDCQRMIMNDLNDIEKNGGGVGL
jgi:hypothetical protein